MDVYDKTKRSAVMRAVKGGDTKPEVAVRKLLHRHGYRFRLRRKDLPGRPDIVLPRHRAVVFVHGCFWHQHAGCPRAARPTTNVAFWTKKLDRNVSRDAENLGALRAAGWRVFTAWECEIGTERFETALLEFLADRA